MRPTETNAADASALALDALVWTLAEPARAERLLALTGLDAAGLRARLGEPALLAAILGFVESHEPDLLACSDSLGVPPTALVTARQTLEQA